MIYLHETRFLKPEVAGCGEVRIDGKKRRYVDAAKGPVPVQYFLDREGNYIPGTKPAVGKIRVRYYLGKGEELPSIVEVRQGGTLRRWYFKKYQTFDGIQLPTEERVRSEIEKANYHLRWEVNPVYDPSVLTSPPNLALGPDGWRPRELRGRTKPDGPPTEVEDQVWWKRLREE